MARPIKERGIKWVERYGDKSAYLKEQFDKQVGPGAYFRWEGHDDTTGTDYYVVITPGYTDPKTKRKGVRGYHFFAGLRKIPAEHGASGKRFKVQAEALSYAMETWGVPVPSKRPAKPYTEMDIRGKAIVMEQQQSRKKASVIIIDARGMIREGMATKDMPPQTPLKPRMSARPWAQNVCDAYRLSSVVPFMASLYAFPNFLVTDANNFEKGNVIDDETGETVTLSGKENIPMYAKPLIPSKEQLRQLFTRQRIKDEKLYDLNNDTNEITYKKALYDDPHKKREDYRAYTWKYFMDQTQTMKIQVTRGQEQATEALLKGMKVPYQFLANPEEGHSLDKPVYMIKQLPISSLVEIAKGLEANGINQMGYGQGHADAHYRLMGTVHEGLGAAQTIFNVLKSPDKYKGFEFDPNAVAYQRMMIPMFESTLFSPLGLPSTVGLTGKHSDPSVEATPKKKYDPRAAATKAASLVVMNPIGLVEVNINEDTYHYGKLLMALEGAPDSEEIMKTYGLKDKNDISAALNNANVLMALNFVGKCIEQSERSAVPEEIIKDKLAEIASLSKDAGMILSQLESVESVYALDPATKSQVLTSLATAKEQARAGLPWKYEGKDKERRMEFATAASKNMQKFNAFLDGTQTPETSKPFDFQTTTPYTKAFGELLTRSMIFIREGDFKDESSTGTRYMSQPETGPNIDPNTKLPVVPKGHRDRGAIDDSPNYEAKAYKMKDGVPVGRYTSYDQNLRVVEHIGPVPQALASQTHETQLNVKPDPRQGYFAPTKVNAKKGIPAFIGGCYSMVRNKETGFGQKVGDQVARVYDTRTLLDDQNNPVIPANIGDVDNISLAGTINGVGVPGVSLKTRRIKAVASIDNNEISSKMSPQIWMPLIRERMKKSDGEKSPFYLPGSEFSHVKEQNPGTYLINSTGNAMKMLENLGFKIPEIGFTDVSDEALLLSDQIANESLKTFIAFQAAKQLPMKELPPEQASVKNLSVKIGPRSTPVSQEEVNLGHSMLKAKPAGFNEQYERGMILWECGSQNLEAAPPILNTLLEQKMREAKENPEKAFAPLKGSLFALQKQDSSLYLDPNSQRPLYCATETSAKSVWDQLVKENDEQGRKIVAIQKIDNVNMDPAMTELERTTGKPVTQVPVRNLDQIKEKIKAMELDESAGPKPEEKPGVQAPAGPTPVPIAPAQALDSIFMELSKRPVNDIQFVMKAIKMPDQAFQFMQYLSAPLPPEVEDQLSKLSPDEQGMLMQKLQAHVQQLKGAPKPPIPAPKPAAGPIPGPKPGPIAPGLPPAPGPATGPTPPPPPTTASRLEKWALKLENEGRVDEAAAVREVMSMSNSTQTRKG